MKKLDQSQVRDRMIEYVRDNGVKYFHFAHEVNVPFYVISLWKNGKKLLWQKSLENVSDYLESKGY